MAELSSVWSVRVSGTSGVVTAGLGACRDSAGIDYVIATTANLAAAGGLLEGIFLTATAPLNTAAIQVAGPINHAVTGLGAGAATTVGLSATGVITRGATPAIGTCNQYGDVVLAAPVAAGGFVAGGDLTGTGSSQQVVAATGAAGTLPVSCATVSNTSAAKVQFRTDIGATVQTTNNTQTTIYSKAISFPDGGGNMEFIVSATDGTDSAVWKVSAFFNEAVATVAFIGATPTDDTTTNSSAGAATWKNKVDLSGNTVRCRGTGEVGKNITWSVVAQSHFVVV